MSARLLHSHQEYLVEDFLPRPANIRWLSSWLTHAENALPSTTKTDDESLRKTADVRAWYELCETIPVEVRERRMPCQAGEVAMIYYSIRNRAVYFQVVPYRSADPVPSDQ